MYPGVLGTELGGRECRADGKVEPQKPHLSQVLDTDYSPESHRLS